MRKKVAIVVQRYGDEVVGGAEALAKTVAEKLVMDLGWEVHVLTTCAREYTSWKNELRPGVQGLNGVMVHRFPSLFGRSLLFPLWNRLATPWILRLQRLSFLHPLVRALEWVWLFLQGPVNWRLARHLKRHLPEYDKVFLYTYLYLPTIWGVLQCREKAVLISTAHDEAPFHFLLIRKMLSLPSKIFAISPAEKELLCTKVQDPSRIELAGLGYDQFVEDQKPLSSTTEGQTPYVLYLGRISKGKKVDLLIQWFLRFCDQNSLPIRLLLAGKAEKEVPIPKDPRVEYLGFLPNDQKMTMIRQAACIINPSPLESLSMIVIEAMLLKRPVLVNRECPVLNDYVIQTQTVKGYEEESEFASNLSAILSRDWNAPESQAQLERSKLWAEQNYSWEQVLQAYAKAL